MTEVPDILFDELAETTRRDYGFAIDPHRFAVIGICGNCQ
jgi:Fe2+ or Zn2+ uptake regulation protein